MNPYNRKCDTGCPSFTGNNLTGGGGFLNRIHPPEGILRGQPYYKLVTTNWSAWGLIFLAVKIGNSVW